MLQKKIKLRALEKEDLRIVHGWNNDANMMRYWFEEPYESFGELEDLYKKHIHDQYERRFIVENGQKDAVGLVELIEIDYIHRKTELTIMIDANYQGQGYALTATQAALNYAFRVLNLHKVYLLVEQRNEKAIHIYKKLGFLEEAVLIDEVFTGGEYRPLLRMYKLTF